MRLLVCALIISSSYAQGRGEDARELFKEDRGFFDTDSAKTSFQPEPIRLEGPELGTFRDDIKRESLKEKLKRQAEEERKKEEALLAAKIGAVSQQESSELASPDDVIKKFGDPKLEPEVLATKDAPKPFQGMMAALHLGDEKLAQQYARQYARFMKTTQERVTRTTNLTGLAMATEGSLDESSWAWRSASESEKALFAGDIEALNALDPAIKYELSDKAKELIRFALDEDDKPKSKSKVSEAELKGFLGSVDEQITFARAQDKKTLIRDSKGEVDVFLFVDVKSRESLIASGYLEKTFRSLKDDGRIRFAVLSVGIDSDLERERFKEQSQLSLPIINGTDLSKVMNVKEFPSLVLVAKNSGKAVTEVGRRGENYIIERIKLIQGRKK